MKYLLFTLIVANVLVLGICANYINAESKNSSTSKMSQPESSVGVLPPTPSVYNGTCDECNKYGLNCPSPLWYCYINFII